MAAPESRLSRVRAVYRVFAPLYDAFRSVWSRLTGSTEEALDALFASRIPPGGRILELGPGTGVNLERLQRLGIAFGAYLGIDASEEMLERARAKLAGDPRVDLRLGDVTHLSGVDGRFDFVVSTWVLSHLDDPFAVVRDATRRLTPGGRAVFLFSGMPRSRLLRACLWPFYRWADARFIDPEPLRELPELEALERRSGGLATLAVLRPSAA
jgi:ArsR family transcriptional regulator